MKKQILQSVKAIVFIVMVVITATGCKKKDNSPGENKPSLVAVWSHLAPVGSFRNNVTLLNLKADGSGNESISSITNFSSTIISDEDLQWSSEQDNILKLQFSTGTTELYTYKFGDEGALLILTSASGVTREYMR